MKRMMEQTRCDRCGHEEIMDAKQGKLTKKYNFTKNPSGWQEVNGYLFCPRCTVDYKQAYHNFFERFIHPVKKQDIKQS